MWRRTAGGAAFERTIGDEDGAAACHSLVGDIILGRVQRVMPGMQAAFVDVGLERAGFLALREAKMLAQEFCDDTAISDCVREGDAMLVQVIKDPIGEKGARLSAGITLPGAILVMTPGQPGIAFPAGSKTRNSAWPSFPLGEELLAQGADGLIPERALFSAPRPKAPRLKS